MLSGVRVVRVSVCVCVLCGVRVVCELCGCVVRSGHRLVAVIKHEGTEEHA